MFLHEMTIPERIDSIVALAEKLTGASAEHEFRTERPSQIVRYDTRGSQRLELADEIFFVLRVAAGDSEWKAGVPNGTRDAGDRLTYSMLLSLAHDAGACPKCHAPMPRNAKPSPGGLRCYSCGCGMQVRERI